MKEQFHIQWHFTNLCNLRCKHCYQDDFSKDKDLDLEGLKRISQNILQTIEEWDKKLCIHLTGGEPLLKKELIPLIGYLDQSPIIDELGIITNGLLIDKEIIDKFSSFKKLRRIKISLDGSNAELNDSIRSEETFNRVIQNISLIQKTGRFEIILMFTAMRRNFRDLHSFIQLSQKLGIDGLIVERFIPLGRGKGITEEILSREEWNELIKILSDLFLIEQEDLFPPYQAYQIILNKGEPELLGAQCIIGNDGLCIMPNGDIYPCRRFPISIGNLLNGSLKSIWERSEILRKLRRKENLMGLCGVCEFKECRGCRSLAFYQTGEFLSEDPHCCYKF